MAWLGQTWRARSILLGLAIHFCLWWALSCWLWTVGTGWRWKVLATSIVPAYMATFSWRDAWPWATTATIICLTLIGLSVLAVRSGRRWIALLSHLAVIVYWVFGIGAIASTY